MKRRLTFSTSNVDVLEEEYFDIEAKYQSILNGKYFELVKHKQSTLKFPGDFPKKYLVTLRLCK